MSAVIESTAQAGLTLDQILFETREPKRSELLEEFVRGEMPVKIALAGESKPREFHVAGRRWTIGPEGVWVTPRIAIEMLYLYGKGGIYRHIDQATGVSRDQLQTMKDEQERKRLEKVVDFFDAYLTHVTEG